MSKPAEASIPSIKTRTKAAAKPTPFPRGLQAPSYAARPLTTLRYAGFFTVEAPNVFFRQALADRRGSRLGVT